ncbi:MAG: hypothetical protein KAJ49_07090, partial [Arcobacteraceae bacterium]|nr:hypothetical protein [Arcobacteraceae bacterium]
YENNITAILRPFNPAGDVGFEHENYGDGNYTRFSVSTFDMNDSENTWQYIENKWKNGVEENETENGTFDLNTTTKIYTMKDGNNTVASEEFKYGEIFNYIALNSLISTDEFSGITFENNDSAVMLYFKQLVTETNTWGDKVKNWRESNETNTVYFTSFSDFITNQSADNMFMSSETNSSRGISFEGGSSGSSGILYEVINTDSSNDIINYNAGDWNITNDILYINPTIAGYDKDRIFKEFTNYIEYGEVSREGDVEAGMLFNNSAMAKLKPYFETSYNQLVSSSTENNDSNTTYITNTFAGKTFYTLDETNTTLESWEFAQNMDEIVFGQVSNINTYIDDIRDLNSTGFCVIEKNESCNSSDWLSIVDDTNDSYIEVNIDGKNLRLYNDIQEAKVYYHVSLICDYAYIADMAIQGNMYFVSEDRKKHAVLTYSIDENNHTRV